MLTVMFKGQWWIISDFSYIMSYIGWGIFVVAFIGSICILVWTAVRMPLSRLMKIKQAYVEILYAPTGGFERPVLVVRFLSPKRRRRKGFYMKIGGIHAGEKGFLRYQGVIGLEFQADAQIIKEDYHQKFGFAKKKKEDQMAAPEKRTHHKRKYW